MKTLSLILNTILLIAVAILFYLWFTGKEARPGMVGEPTFAGDSTSLIKNDSIFRTTAFINTDTLFEKYLFVKDMRDELAEEKLKSEANYSAELKKLEKEFYEFQEKARYMTQQEGESKQLELAEKEQKLMKLERDLTSKLAEIEMEKNKIIQKNVSDYLEKVNKEKRYAYIFGFNGTGNILLANPGFDITSEIIVGLNEEYNAKKTGSISKN